MSQSSVYDARPSADAEPVPPESSARPRTSAPKPSFDANIRRAARRR